MAISYPTDYWCKKRPSEALHYMPLEQHLLATFLGSPGNRGCPRACDPPDRAARYDLGHESSSPQAQHGSRGLSAAGRSQIRTQRSRSPSLSSDPSPWHLGSPLGSTEWTEMGTHILPRWAHHRVCCCFVSLSQGAPEYDWTPPSAQGAKVQVVTCALDALAISICTFFQALKLLGNSVRVPQDTSYVESFLPWNDWSFRLVYHSSHSQPGPLPQRKVFPMLQHVRMTWGALRMPNGCGLCPNS